MIRSQTLLLMMIEYQSTLTSTSAVLLWLVIVRTETSLLVSIFVQAGLILPPLPHPIRKSSDLWTMSYLVISNCAGTWFISELCQTLCKFSRVMDLDEMQKKVNAQVVQNYTIHSTEKKKTDAGVSRMFFSSHWCWCTLVEPSTVDTCDIML